MRIYILCPVRRITPEQEVEITDYVAQLEAEGHIVHFPPRDVDRVDETGGFRICSEHAAFMYTAERIDIFWDCESAGSHFDLGMGFMRSIPVKLVRVYHPDGEGKSFLKVIKLWEEKCKAS